MQKPTQCIIYLQTVRKIINLVIKPKFLCVSKPYLINAASPYIGLAVSMAMTEWKLISLNNSNKNQISIIYKSSFIYFSQFTIMAELCNNSLKQKKQRYRKNTSHRSADSMSVVRSVLYVISIRTSMSK